MQVDANNAILSKNGGCGLFVNEQKIVVVSDKNLNKYLGKRAARLILPQAQTVKKPVVIRVEEVPDAEDTVLVDSVAVKDTIVNTADTLKDSVVNKAIVDTLQNNLE